MENKIHFLVKNYQYSEAKNAFSVFLKTILETLLSQNNKNILIFQKNKNYCITSLIFRMLSDVEVDFHKNKNKNNDEFKDILRFLSENVFKVLDCKQLIFNNESELESFIRNKNNVLDVMLECKIHNKINYLHKLDFELMKLNKSSSSSSIEVIQMVGDLLLRTNSQSLHELNEGIKYLENQFSHGEMFDWKNLTHTALEKYDKGTVTELPVKPEAIIYNSKIDFADTILNVLGHEQDFDFLILTQPGSMLNIVTKMLNHYFRERLKNTISPQKQDISEEEIKSVYFKYKKLLVLEKILQTEDEDETITKVKSMHYVFDKLLKMYNIQDEYTLLDVIQKQNDYLIKNPPSSTTRASKDLEKVINNTLLRINNSSTLEDFIKDFTSLYTTFLNNDFNLTFSVNNLETVIKNFKTLENEIKSLKIKLSDYISTNKTLELQLQPFIQLEKEIGLNLANIVEFTTSIYKLKPSNVKDVKLFFDSCQKKLKLFDGLNKENVELQKNLEKTSVEIANMENELLNFQELKRDHNYCKQKLLDSENVIQNLVQEKDEILQELEELKLEHEEYKNALIVGEAYNKERNEEIDRLEEQVFYLKSKLQ